MILTEKIGPDTPQHIVDVVNLLKKKVKPLNLKHVDCWIAGGYFRSAFNDEEIHDIDIFFKNINDIDVLKSTLNEGFTENSYHVRGNFNDPTSGRSKDDDVSFAFAKAEFKVSVDLIKKFTYINAEELLSDFDFSVCKFAYSVKDNTFYYDSKGFIHLKAKRLVITNPEFNNPVGSMKRLKKYFSYGYDISSESINLIANRIAELGTSCIKTSCIKVNMYDDDEAKDQIKINAFDLILPNENWKVYLEMNPNVILHKSFPDTFNMPVNNETQERLIKMARSKTIEWDKIKGFVSEENWDNSRGARGMAKLKKGF